MNSPKAASGSEYQGPDRRHHRVFVTHHTEYHCRDGVCVAVRNRKTGAFVTEHRAIGRHVDCSLLFTSDGGIECAHSPAELQVGEHVCFSSGDIDDAHNVLTSELEDIARPPKEIVAAYPRTETEDPVAS